LSDELYVAYDARYCGLYKAWKGEVILDGPVYTTKHGPQPTSEGYAYFEERLHAPAWRLVVDGTEVIPKAQFKGHLFKKGQVTFRFHLEDDQGHFADIEETPEYVSKSGKNGLHRHFVITNKSEGIEVVIKTTLTNLQQENDFDTNGKITVESKEEKKYENGSTVKLAITLVLNHDATDLKVYYHPGFEIPKEEASGKAGSLIEQGNLLINGSDCRTCHNEGVKTVGPAYLDVAKKYEFTQANVEILAGKIIKEGAVYGTVPMTPHPDLMPEDAEKMVHYILSLDGKR
jgi:cytochrome c